MTPYGCANLSKGGAENFVTRDTHHRFLTSEVVVAARGNTQGRLFQEQLRYNCCVTSFKRQHHPEVPLPAWSWIQTCDKAVITPALDSLVSQGLQNAPHKARCSSIWKAHSSQLRILIVFPFRLWLHGNIITSILPQTKEKKKKGRRKKHSKKWKFTQ